MHRRRRPLFAAVVFACWLATPGSLRAQAGLPQLEDASVLPRGILRLRAITSWTRFDARFADSGVAPLGTQFTGDSLGVATLPTLAPAATALEALAGPGVTLSLGRSRLDARAREEIVPFALEYGLTRRLTLGVVVPVVRRRVAVQFRLDSAGANVGPNLALTSVSAQQADAQVQAEFSNAASLLQQRLQFCAANQSASGCGTLLSRQQAATQLIASSQSYAANIAILYGNGTTSGQPFVPVATSQAQAAVLARIADFNAQYKDFLGTSTDLFRASPAAAGGPAGTADLQAWLFGMGRDSVTTQERSGVGDIELGARALLVDRARSSKQRLGMQLVAAIAARLPTGSRGSPSDIADLTLGGGVPAVNARAAFDGRFGRAGLLLVGDGTFATGTAPSGSDSRIVGVDVAPRWHLSEPVAFHLAYSLRSGNASGSPVQLVGGGVSVSTLAAYRASGGTLPLEMRFTHLEAIDGPAGSPKFFRDQMEVRIYYRLLPR